MKGLSWGMGAEKFAFYSAGRERSQKTHMGLNHLDVNCFFCFKSICPVQSSSFFFFFSSHHLIVKKPTLVTPEHQLLQ